MSRLWSSQQLENTGRTASGEKHDEKRKHFFRTLNGFQDHRIRNSIVLSQTSEGRLNIVAMVWWLRMRLLPWIWKRRKCWCRSSRHEPGGRMLRNTPGRINSKIHAYSCGLWYQSPLNVFTCSVRMKSLIRWIRKTFSPTSVRLWRSCRRLLSVFSFNVRLMIRMMWHIDTKWLSPLSATYTNTQLQLTPSDKTAFLTSCACHTAQAHLLLHQVALLSSTTLSLHALMFVTSVIQIYLTVNSDQWLRNRSKRWMWRCSKGLSFDLFIGRCMQRLFLLFSVGLVQWPMIAPSISLIQHHQFPSLISINLNQPRLILSSLDLLECQE